MKTLRWWLAATLLVAAGVWLWPRSPGIISSQRYAAILEDVMGVDFVLRAPTPDPTGTRIAYIHGAAQGRGLFILDLATQARMEVALTNEVTRINGWSPDGRYLAFVQAAPEPAADRVLQGNEYATEAWVTLYDSTDGTVQRLTENHGVIESHFFWLSPTTYLVTSRKLTNDLAEMFLGQVGEPPVDKVSNYMPEFMVMNERLAAYAYKGANIFELEIKPLKWSARWGWDDNSRTIRQLSQFAAGDFDGIRWLRYSTEAARFLFCARPTNSTWRYLFEFDPATRQCRQLTDEDTYNGQWLRGEGFAYVGNTNNSFFLAVRPQDSRGPTNLFTRGSVVTYQASSDGDRLYAVASVGVEPQGLWEYVVSSSTLRMVVDGVTAPFDAAQIIEPKEFRVKSFDGLEIPCFWFQPVHSGSERRRLRFPLHRRARQPVVIFLPPRTGQFQRSFDARAQLLANLGFHFVAINYRGCDGYGRDYASLGSAEDAAKDALALYEQIVKVPDVDRRNVFLSSSSDGSVVAYELLARHPELWRGAALENPTAPDFNRRFDPRRLPPVFFASGDQDRAWPHLHQFETWGKTNRLNIQSVIYTNAGHIIFKSAERKDKLARVSRFLLDQVGESSNFLLP